MAQSAKPPVLVVVQLSGGNDFMNTIVPFTNPIYYDSRPKVVIPEDEVLPLNDTLGWNPNTAPIKELYDEGTVAIIQGIGMPDSPRSHFRAMDVWHTANPSQIGGEGWLAKVIRELDPNKENPLIGLNFGRGLPRAMAAPGVPVSSVGDLDNYGLLSPIEEAQQRSEALEIFKNMYGPAIGAGPVMDYMSQTAMDVIKGADLLKKPLSTYSSDVEYADNDIAKSLRDVARVHLADLGTRVFYTSQGGYDHHANEMASHPGLLSDVSGALMDFMHDLRDHDASEEVVILVFTEFGRRIVDNGSGTDHGSGGGAFIIGDRVEGGLYAEYPSLEPDQWENGEDLEHTIDFRGIYGTIIEQWLGLEASPIVGGTFEQVQPFK